jgi:hypothetical protein
MTMIFSTDDFCRSRSTLKGTYLTIGPLDMMRKNASRMRVVSVYDLSGSESMRALRHLRRQNLRARTGKQDVEVESDEILRQVYERIGGRTSYLAKVSRADDMLGTYEGTAVGLG